MWLGGKRLVVLRPVDSLIQPLKNSNPAYFVTAIHTDSGKTFSSAILLHHLKADYWKPIQCGFPGDSEFIREVAPFSTTLHPERHRLQTPASPHFAARKEEVTIELSDFRLPDTNGRPLIVEGAGGLMVPLNSKNTLADLISHLNIPVILVINHYLGALNHSLLTLAELERREIPIAGIIFNGEDFQGAEEIILSRTQSPCLLRIPTLIYPTKSDIEALANQIRWN